MERVAQVDAFGGPEAIVWHDETLPPPGPGEVTMRHTAVGLNFIDTYHRRGTYPLALPARLGVEASGVVTAVGEGVTGLAAGDRVCTLGPVTGTYSTARNVAAAQVMRTPDDIPDELAAAALLKGCTAEFLIERCARVQPGDAVLVHAAAGGVGLLLVQWLKHIGATVIGTTSSAAKAEIARAAGADHVIDYTAADTAAQVRALTGGAGVRVTFDGVGQDTWQTSLAATGRRGLIVSYGNASGAVSGVALGSLAAAGSLFCTRPTLYDYYADPAERQAGAARMFDLLRHGVLKVTIGQTYPLEQVARAHTDLQARRTTGSTVLTV